MRERERERVREREREREKERERERESKAQLHRSAPQKGGQRRERGIPDSPFTSQTGQPTPQGQRKLFPPSQNIAVWERRAVASQMQ